MDEVENRSCFHEPNIDGLQTFLSQLSRFPPDGLTLTNMKTVIEMIKENHLGVNQSDENEDTLLNQASTMGFEDVVEFLCANGLDVNSSALHFATIHDRPAIVGILLR